MSLHFRQNFNVAPNGDLIIRISGETFMHRVGNVSTVEVEITERGRMDSAAGRPDMGAPSLMINPLSGDDIRTR